MSDWITGGANLLGGVANVISGAVQNKKNRQFQKKMTEKQWARDDTAVQRRADDLESAGINRLIAGGSQGGTMQSGMAQTVQGQAPMVGEMIANIPRDIANINKTEAETDSTITQTAFDKGSFDDRLDMVKDQLAGLRWDNKVKQQEIENMLASKAEIEQNVALKIAQEMLVNAQTETEKKELVRVVEAGKLLTEQWKTELKNQTLTEQEIKLVFEKVFSEQKNQDLLREQIYEASRNNRIGQINEAWFKGEKVTNMSQSWINTFANVWSALKGGGSHSNTYNIGTK